MISEKDCLQLYRAIPSAVLTVDTNRIITSVNDLATALFGYTSEEVVGKSCSLFCSEPCFNECKLFDKDTPKPIIAQECIVKRSDGTLILVSKNINLLRDDKGNIVGGIEIFEDITGRKRVEEALCESEERYRTLYDSTANPVFVTDMKGNYIDCNESACRFFERTREELLTLNVRDILPENWEKKLHGLKTLLKTGGTAEAEYFINNKPKFLELNVTPSVWQGRRVVVCVGKDITDRKQAEAKILYMAYHDVLTGFPNRALFKKILTTAITHARVKNEKLAVMFLDLDRFKTVNDILGHDSGDQLLQAVAQRLQSSIRRGDTVARLSGDEFVILLSGISGVNDTARVSQKIIDSFREPLSVGGREWHITVSVGITLFPMDGDNEKALLQNADVAMYQAKEQGGNTYCFYTPAMNEKVMARLELENYLRGALDREEFILHYQPQVNSNTGEIVGMEALIRWQHPQLGLVPPMDFIPLAEETGLIIPIGEWVLYNACAQNKIWQEKGYPHIKVAVNISARQFQQGNLVSMIDRILKQTKLAPNCLELEITESTAMQNLNHTTSLVKELKNMGVSVSIDDFGIGYASLSYLKLFPPIDTLKIDRSFVKDITQRKENASGALVATMIVLAKNLKLKVVAEGVENTEQLEFLKKQQCDYIQGYLFSKPLPAGDFEDLLKRQPFANSASKE